MTFEDLLYLVTASAVFLVIFFYLYILVMGIYRAYLAKTLTNKFVFTMCLPPIILGFTFDIIANIIFATLIFRQLPTQWLVTTRLAQILANEHESKDRKELAQYICDNLLDIFDPSGDHCKL